MTLRPYQETFINNIAASLRSNRKVVAQLATGGGKTVCFSAICDRYCAKSSQDILILVHREELLAQATKAIRIPSQPVTAGMKSIPHARVYVAMVETAYKRLDKFTNIGLVIVDECISATSPRSSSTSRSTSSASQQRRLQHARPIPCATTSMTSCAASTSQT